MQDNLFNRTEGEVFKKTHTQKHNKALWVDTRSKQTYVIFELSTSLNGVGE